MKRVLVALSGGVDSSTTAAILKKQGYDVSGGIMVFEGVSQESIESARASAHALAIRLYVFDVREEFQNVIIRHFVREYCHGRTPNPCILCNTLMKFGLLVKKAHKLGIDTVATGHYARVEKHNNRYLLKRGIDRNEQSYFLYRLSQEQLSKVIMPLGSLTKVDVRRIAHDLGLPAAHRAKSHDICFIPDGNYCAFLKQHVPCEPGPVYDKKGTVIGQHKGILSYTYGQRKRIGISHKHPYYVTRIDAAKNAIHVGDKEDVMRQEIVVGETHFIPFDKLRESLAVMAKPRYVTPLCAAIIRPYRKKIRVAFETPQWALTPGQSVVFYHDDIVLGGGIIEQVQ